MLFNSGTTTNDDRSNNVEKGVCIYEFPIKMQSKPVKYCISLALLKYSFVCIPFSSVYLSLDRYKDKHDNSDDEDNDVDDGNGDEYD